MTKKAKLLLLCQIIVFTCSVTCFIGIVTTPKPPSSNGTVWTKWQLTSGNNKRFVITSHPEQNFGTNNIHYHWFGKTTVEFVDEGGTLWKGKMMNEKGQP